MSGGGLNQAVAIAKALTGVTPTSLSAQLAPPPPPPAPPVPEQLAAVQQPATPQFEPVFLPLIPAPENRSDVLSALHEACGAQSAIGLPREIVRVVFAYARPTLWYASVWTDRSSDPCERVARDVTTGAYAGPPRPVDRYARTSALRFVPAQSDTGTVTLVAVDLVAVMSRLSVGDDGAAAVEALPDGTYPALRAGDARAVIQLEKRIKATAATIAGGQGPDGLDAESSDGTGAEAVYVLLEGQTLKRVAVGANHSRARELPWMRTHRSCSVLFTSVPCYCPAGATLALPAAIEAKAAAADALPPHTALYAIGGDDHRKELKRFCVARGEWVDCAPLPHVVGSEDGAAAVVSGGAAGESAIYMFADHSDQFYTHQTVRVAEKRVVFRYDVARDRWVSLQCELGIAPFDRGGGIGAAAVTFYVPKPVVLALGKAKGKAPAASSGVTSAACAAYSDSAGDLMDGELSAVTVIVNTLSESQQTSVCLFDTVFDEWCNGPDSLATELPPSPGSVNADRHNMCTFGPWIVVAPNPVTGGGTMYQRWEEACSPLEALRTSVVRRAWLRNASRVLTRGDCPFAAQLAHSAIGPIDTADLKWRSVSWFGFANQLFGASAVV